MKRQKAAARKAESTSTSISLIVLLVGLFISSNHGHTIVSALAQAEKPGLTQVQFKPTQNLTNDSWKRVELMGKVTLELPPDMKAVDTYADVGQGAILREFDSGELALTLTLGPGNGCASLKDLRVFGSVKPTYTSIDGRRAWLLVQSKGTDRHTALCVPGIGNKRLGLWISVSCTSCPAQNRMNATVDRIFKSISFNRSGSEGANH